MAPPGGRIEPNFTPSAELLWDSNESVSGLLVLKDTVSQVLPQAGGLTAYISHTCKQSSSPRIQWRELGDNSAVSVAGWRLGPARGQFRSFLYPAALSSALGIALYRKRGSDRLVCPSEGTWVTGALLERVSSQKHVALSVKGISVTTFGYRGHHKSFSRLSSLLCNTGTNV